MGLCFLFLQQMALGFSERNEASCCCQPCAVAPPALPIRGALSGQNNQLIFLPSSLPVGFLSVQKEGFDLGISPPLIPELSSSSWGFPSNPEVQQHTRAPVWNPILQPCSIAKKKQPQTSISVYCKQGHWEHTACSRACIAPLRGLFSIKMAVENGVHGSVAIRHVRGTVHKCVYLLPTQRATGNFFSDTSR